MDPVQKAVINHTFGVAPPKKKPIISCNICHLRFNSTVSQTLSYIREDQIGFSELSFYKLYRTKARRLIWILIHCRTLEIYHRPLRFY